MAQIWAEFNYLAPSFIPLLGLMGLYTFGVWLRTYVFPTGRDCSLKRQLLASIPIGLVTMAGYAKTALPSVSVDPNSAVFDISLIAGYAIIFGMLSRDVLERVLQGAAPIPTLPRVTP